MRARAAGAILAAGLAASALAPPDPPGASLVPEIDRIVREQFWDPAVGARGWDAAVRRAGEEIAAARTPVDRDAAYDRLLATLHDSHTFRMPVGFPERRFGTAGLRIGRDGDGYAVKGILPGHAADRAGLRLGDRVLSVAGRPYSSTRPNFRDLFFALEGPIGTEVAVAWKRGGDGRETTSRLMRDAEEPGDTLVWKSARVISRGGAKYGYVRLWGMSADTALAVVELLSDRDEASRAKPELSEWPAIAGVLLDVRGNSGGYDPHVLTTFLRGRWSAADYQVWSRGEKSVVPPGAKPLPVALLVNSGTASAGEALALGFRTHRIGPIVGEETAGMLSGGAAAERLSDGSTLWVSRRAIRGIDGRSYEGRGIAPDVAVADRPPAGPGLEEAVVEAAIVALVRPAPR